MSNYRVDQYGSYERVGSFTELTQQASAIVVTDISIGLENPLILLPGMYKDWCAK